MGTRFPCCQNCGTMGSKITEERLLDVGQRMYRRVGSLLMRVWGARLYRRFDLR